MLIVVPHPDDETLATGGLIQLALAAGAALRVVIVTDGDNNPWPQRWFEKRWRIDAEARKRWGKRRRDEAVAALARLGVAESDVRHFGWPDQGLTALLMRDAQCEDRLAFELVDFAPTLVVAPSLADRHPDHNALRVMLELALARTPFAACRQLGFVVHGPMPKGRFLKLALSEEQARKKREALQAHTSQLILSGNRMTRICERDEQFEVNEKSASERARTGYRDCCIAYSPSGFHLHQRALYVIVEFEGRVVRASLPLPIQPPSGNVRLKLDDQERLGVQIQASGEELRISLSGEHAIRPIFAKIERLGARLLIYDASGWTH